MKFNPSGSSLLRDDDPHGACARAAARKAAHLTANDGTHLLDSALARLGGDSVVLWLP